MAWGVVKRVRVVEIEGKIQTQGALNYHVVIGVFPPLGALGSVCTNLIWYHKERIFVVKQVSL